MPLIEGPGVVEIYKYIGLGSIGEILNTRAIGFLDFL